MIDKLLRQDAINELNFVPSVDAADTASQRPMAS